MFSRFSRLKLSDFKLLTAFLYIIGFFILFRLNYANLSRIGAGGVLL